MQLRSLAITVLGIALGALPAAADDGVIEINQARALAGGITPLDAPGFPVVISVSGSYRLTSDLVPPPDTTAITENNASNVTLDLNGFSVIGSSQGGQTTGIQLSSGNGWHIENGTVRDFSLFGIQASGVGTGHLIRHVRALNNASDGIHLGNANSVVVEGCHASDNGGAGISVGESSVIRASTARKNGQSGMTTAQGGTITASASHDNTGSGFFLGSGSLLSQSTSYSNTINGVTCSFACEVTDSVLASNTEDGANLGSGCLVRNVTARNNGQHGLDLGATTGYSGSVLTSNTGGTVSGGVELGENLCELNTTCP